jgi:hypothetical protein
MNGMRAILFLAACAVALHAAAQAGQWEVFDTGNGALPSDRVRCLLEDAEGTIWVGTDWGLSAFDGEQWSLHQVGNGSGVPSNEISCLAVDASGRLWVGTLFHGIGIYDGVDWSYINSSTEGLPLDEVNGIFHDHRGWTWVSTPIGLFCDTGSGWRTYNDTPESHNGFQFFLPNVRAVAVRSDDLVSVATTNSGLNYFTETEFIYYTTFNAFFPDNSANAIALDSNGDRWLACPSGGLVWHAGDFLGGPWFAYNVFTAGLPDNTMTSVVIDGNDRKYVGTQTAGVLLFDDIGSWSVLNGANSGLPDNEVLSVLVTTDGVLWAGTAQGGAARFEPAAGMSSAWGGRPELSCNPNPAIERFHVQGLPIELNVEWTLLDASGRMVRQGVFGPHEPRSIRIDGLGPGAYIVRVGHSDGRNTSARVIVAQ